MVVDQKDELIILHLIYDDLAILVRYTQAEMPKCVFRDT